MPAMKIVQVSASGAELELVEREIPYPLAGHVGARVILATAPNSKAMSELVGGLDPHGTLVVVGATMDVD